MLNSLNISEIHENETSTKSQANTNRQRLEVDAGGYHPLRCRICCSIDATSRQADPIKGQSAPVADGANGGRCAVDASTAGVDPILRQAGMWAGRDSGSDEMGDESESDSLPMGGAIHITVLCKKSADEEGKIANM